MFRKKKDNAEELSDSKSLLISIIASLILLFADKLYQLIFPQKAGESLLNSGLARQLICFILLLVFFLWLYRRLFHKSAENTSKANLNKSAETITERLSILDELKAAGTITETEYHKRRKEIIREI